MNLERSLKANPVRMWAATVFLATAAIAVAQDSRGSITGHVLDPTGAGVVGTTVVIANVETNAITSVATNSNGIYQGLSLPTGRYRMTAESKGFKRFVRDEFMLPASTSVTIDIRLQLGETSESITVTGDAPLLETDTVTAGRALETKDMLDLPGPGANAALLAKLAPGVMSPTGMNELIGGGTLHAFALDSNFFMAGNVGSPVWTMDGMVDTGSGRHIGYIPSTDIVAEVKVETANFDASVGQTSSMNVTMTSKSGTNELHGSARYLFWNQRWAAMTFFQKQQYYTNVAAAQASGNAATLASVLATNPQPSAHQHNYGVTLGGPVYLPKLVNGRNKLFFLFNYTGDRAASSRTSTPLQTGTVPTITERGGDFSDLLITKTGASSNAAVYQIYDPTSTRLDPARPGHVIRDPFPGNILPRSRMVSPIAAAYARFLPLPNNNPSDPTVVATQNDRWQEVTPTATVTVTARMDYNLSDRSRFFFRYNRMVWNQNNQDNTLDMIGSGNIWRYVPGFTGSWTYTISPTLMLTTSIGTNLVEIGTGLKAQQNYKPSSVGFPSYMDTTPSGATPYLPIVNISGYSIGGQGGANLGLNPNGAPSRNRVSSARSDLTYIHGKHTLRFGADFRQMFFTQWSIGNAAGNFGFSNAYTKKSEDDSVGGTLGLSYAAFLLGMPSSASIDNNTSWVFTNPYYATYVQETWRATPKLTLNFGLRMEYELGARERFGRALGGFNPTATLPITTAAQAAYSPVSTISPAYTLPGIQVQGGTLYPGANGNTARLWGNALLWLPRIGAAYQLNAKTVIRGGYGVYYDTLNVNNQGSFDQSYYSVATSTTFTNDNGITWLTGNPAAGVSPLTNPFPTLASGARYVAAYGNSLGLMAKAGTSYTYPSVDAPHARNQRWRIGIQREVGKAMLLDVAYAGQYNSNLNTNLNRDAVPQPYYSTSTTTQATAINSDLSAQVINPFYIGNYAALQSGNPQLYQYMSTTGFFTSKTIQKAQLLKPFPQMTGLSAGAYGAGDGLGSSKVHSLEATFSRRFAAGLSMTGTYAHNYERDRTALYNSFDTVPVETMSNNSRPDRFTGTGIWELPLGRGRKFANHGLTNYVFGGWEISVVYELQSGALLSFPNAFFNGDPNSVTSTTRTLGQWFDTTNFVRATAQTPNGYNIRSFPQFIAGERADIINLWHGNVMRNFKLKERATMQLRMNVYDLFNRSEFNGPDLTPTSATFGKVNSTFGSNRALELQARITF